MCMKRRASQSVRSNGGHRSAESASAISSAIATAITATRIGGNSSLRRQRRGGTGRSRAAETQSCREDLAEKIHFSARRIHLARVTGR